jgi:Spy/CpxP family protein refolding chaperone
MCSQAIFADEHDKSYSCPKMAMMMDKLKSELNLTEEQQQKIEMFKKQMMDQIEANKAKLKSIRDQMHELVRAPQLDQTKLDTLVNEKKEILGTMMKNKITMKHQIYNMLTEEQKKKWDEMMQKWESKHDDKNEMHDDDND